MAVNNAGGTPITNSAHIGHINPIRYRGYYYDTDLGLYYLQSRYYNPQIGRFINADGYISTGQGVLGHNMYAYCGNNPVTRSDSTGNSWDEFWEDVVKSSKILSFLVDVYDSITTPKKVADSLTGYQKSQYEHAKNVTNTIYNISKTPKKDVGSEFVPFNKFNPNDSYTEHISKIIEEPQIYALTEITQGRSWDEVVIAGDADKVCDEMIVWDRKVYYNTYFYHQWDMASTFFDSLY